MRTQTRVLLALLFLLSFSWAGAQDAKETTLKIAGDRTAVLHGTGTESPDPDVSGNLKGSADLKAGKSAFKADLVLKNTPELQGAKAGLYTQMTGKSIEAIGFIDAKIPEEPDSPKTLTIKGETVTEGDQSAGNFDINVLVPAQGEDVPNGSGDMKFEGDFKAIKSSGNFSFSGADIKTDEIPFQSMNFEITEVENKTTISFEMKVAKDSELAAQLDSLPMAAGMIEGQLKQQGIKYEGLDFPAPTVEGESKVGKAKLTIVDLRGTIRPYLGFASAQLQAEMGPDVDVNGAFESMLEVKMDKLGFGMSVAGEKLDGNFEMNASNLGKFYEGYLILIPAIQKQSNQELAREAGELGPLIVAFLELNSEQAVKALKALVESSMSMSGDAKFNLGKKEQDVSFTASGNIMTKNYQDYVTKAKAAGLPVAEKAVGHFDLELKDKTNLVGDMYLYTDGDLVTYYKGMMETAATKANAPAEVLDAVKGLEFDKMAMKLNLQDSKMTIEGNSSTSDLTAISNIAIKQAMMGSGGTWDAKLTGANFDVQAPEGSDGKIDFKVFFSDFYPGKDEAAIREALGLPGSVKIAMDAPADEAKLVAVEVPEITVDGKLADVQASGQKLLASSPADIGGGEGGASGGGNKWGLIALGALLLVGVGGFLMFGKK